YLANAARGNLGESFAMRRPVSAVLAERLPRTALIAGAALLLGFALGIGVALLQAARAGSWTDGALGALALVFYSTPTFWLGLVLAGMRVPGLLAGAVLVETVLGGPGLGRLTHDAIVMRDYNVMFGAAMLSGALVALGNLAADLAVHALDPLARR